MENDTVVSRLYYLLTHLMKIVDRVESVIAVSSLIIIVLMGAIEIVMRYIFSISFLFVYETSLLLANWMYYIGFCLVVNRGLNIEIEFFVKKLSASTRKLLAFATEVTVIILLAILLWYLWDLLMMQSTYKTDGVGIPKHWFSLPLLFCFVSIIISSTKNFLAIYLGQKET